MPSILDDSLAIYDEIKRRQAAGPGGPTIRDSIKAAAATRAAGLKLREDQNERENALRDRSLDLEEQWMNYQQSILDAKREDEMLDKADAAGAIRELGPLTGREEDFDTKMDDILSRYPRALNDNNFRLRWEHRVNTRDRYEQLRQNRLEQTEAKKAAEAAGLQPRAVQVVDGKESVTYAPKVSAKLKADDLHERGVIGDKDYTEIMSLPDEEQRLFRLRSAEGAHVNELAATKQKMAATNAKLRQLQTALKAIPITDVAKQKEIMDQILALGDDEAAVTPGYNERAAKIGVK